MSRWGGGGVSQSGWGGPVASVASVAPCSGQAHEYGYEKQVQSVGRGGGGVVNVKLPAPVTPQSAGKLAEEARHALASLGIQRPASSRASSVLLAPSMRP